MRQSRFASRGGRLGRSLFLSIALAVPGLLVAGAAVAVELQQPEVVGGASTTLQNSSNTVRLEQPQVDWAAGERFVVPEPTALWMLGSGVGMLWLLQRRRRRDHLSLVVGCGHED